MGECDGGGVDGDQSGISEGVESRLLVVALNVLVDQFSSFPDAPGIGNPAITDVDQAQQQAAGRFLLRFVEVSPGALGGSRQGARHTTDSVVAGQRQFGSFPLTPGLS